MARLAVVDPELCNPSKCQLECIRDCPVNRAKKDCIVLSEDKSIAIISEALCTGCGICPKVCPFHAISIVNTVAPVEDKQIYRYGENLFVLYGLALPKKGVIGVVGENGCGKSTTVKLLTGVLTPQNKYSKEVAAYFDAFNSSLVAVKPQEIAGKIKGRVRALLESINEAGRLQALDAVLDLHPLYERDFSQLSGGELQRVVVAAALLREKDTYILDEPLAFLDYAYRIRLAQYLKDNFSEKNVLLVDHDLSLLSHACHAVYLMYGVPGTYGIASQPYAVDRGINMFLEGFIEPENVRFRHHISYKMALEEPHRTPSFTVPPVVLKKGSFSIENEALIQLMEGEIVGVAGPNGTGKSTLAQHLVETHGEAAALKPQILSRPTGIVGEVTSIAHHVPWAETFVRTMNIGKLEFMPFKSLSSGELQKVELLRTLSQEGPSLFVLDEPTNAMDAVGRIALSKLLREKAAGSECTMIVIDHDFEFLLNTVDRLIVFGGTPSVKGRVEGIFSKDEGVARLLAQFDLSYRSDPASKRLKLNKRGSVKDRELKERGTFVER